MKVTYAIKWRKRDTMRKQVFNTVETMISTQIRNNNKKVGVAGAGLALVTLGVSAFISKYMDKKNADEMLEFANATNRAISAINDVIVESASDKNQLLKNINKNLDRQTAVFEQLNFIVNDEEDEAVEQTHEDDYDVTDPSSQNPDAED